MTYAMPRRTAVAMLGGFLSSACSHALAQTATPTATPEETHHLFVTDATTPQQIPARIQDAVFVQAAVNGHDMWFVLDSGSSALAIAKAAAADANVGKDRRGILTADMTIGPLTAHNCYFARMRGRWEWPDGTRLSGLVGAPFFNSNVTTIDWPNRRVLIYPNGSFDASKVRVAPITIGFNDRLPIVHAYFGDTRATMLIDTGADRTLLFQSFGKDVTLGPALSDLMDLQFINEEPIPGRQWLTKPLTLGHYKIPSPLVIIADRPPRWDRLLIDGIIGRELLRALSVTFDYANAFVYLER